MRTDVPRDFCAFLPIGPYTYAPNPRAYTRRDRDKGAEVATILPSPFCLRLFNTGRHP